VQADEPETETERADVCRQLLLCLASALEHVLHPQSAAKRIHTPRSAA
jgi:hypothetical protein